MKKLDQINKSCFLFQELFKEQESLLEKFIQRQTNAFEKLTNLMESQNEKMLLILEKEHIMMNKVDSIKKYFLKKNK